MRHGLCAIVIILVVYSGVAHTHHVVSDSGIAWVEPVSVLEVDVEAANFDHGESQGTWQRLRLIGQFALHERLSLSVQLPVTAVQFQDGRGALGNGDVEVGAKVELWGTEHGELLVSAGAGVEFPTAVAEDALGSGHVEIAPFVALSTQWHPNWLGFALLSTRHAVTERDTLSTTPGRLAHGAAMSLHALDEAFLRLGVAYAEQDRWYASAGIDAVAMYKDPSRGPWVARAEFGFHVQRWWRVALGGEATLAGEARFGRKLRVNSAVFF